MPVSCNRICACVHAYTSVHQAIKKFNLYLCWLCIWLPCRLYCNIAIVSPDCSSAFVSRCGLQNAEVHVVTSTGFVTDLVLSEKPTFNNVNNSHKCAKVRTHFIFIKKQTSSFWPVSSPM